MTKQGFKKWVCGVSAVVLLTATSWGASVTAQIPFPFTAGGKLLPAGNYQLTTIDGRNALRVEQTDGKEFTYLLFQQVPLKNSDASYLSFNRYGSEYFLREMNAVGNARCTILKSGREGMLASELAKKFGKGERAALPTKVNIYAKAE